MNLSGSLLKHYLVHKTANVCRQEDKPVTQKKLQAGNGCDRESIAR